MNRINFNPMKISIGALCLFVLCFLPASVAGQKERSLRVGWSHVDITPDGPVRMRGGIQSEGVLDPITATVLALESGGGDPSEEMRKRAAILVSCDLQHITDGNRYEANMRDDVRALVTAAVPELSGSQIILMATHTHVGPSVQSAPEYNQFASKKIADAVVAAWKKRSPGGISFGLGHAVVGHNRLTTFSDGRSRMVGSFQKGTTHHPDFLHLEGFEDHSVHLLYTTDQDRNLTGVVVNVTCPAQVQRGDKLSADYWHEVREQVREKLGADIAVLPQISAAGDIANIVMVEKKGEARMQALRAKGEADFRVQRRAEMARRIVAAITDTWAVVKSEVDFAPQLKHALASPDLPGGFPGPDGSLFPVEIHALRIGEIAMVTNPFELYLDYGIRIKGRSPATQTFVVQLAGSASYLPTERAIKQGGYGAIEKTCVVGPQAGEVIVSESLRLLGELWE